MSIFSAAEIAARHRRLRERLDGCDAFVSFSFFNAYYLSGVPIIGWGRPTLVVLPARGDPAIVAAAGEKSRIARYSPIEDIRTYTDIDRPNVDSAVALAAEVIRERHIGSIAFDAAMTPAATVELLRGLAPGVELRDMSRALDELKVIYSPEELALLRIATAVCDHGIETFIGRAAVGRSELAVAGEAGTAMSQFASERFPDAEIRINCYSQQGLRTLEPHTASKGTPIESGNLMCIVIEVYAWSYQAAVERTVAFGALPDDAERLYRAIVAAHGRAIEAVGPGTTFSEVDRVAREVFGKAGFGHMPSGAGCGRGLMTEHDGRVDGMNLRPYNDAVLRPEMVMTVEPFVVADGIGAPRHCDMVRVTDSGREVMSRARAGTIRIG